MTNDMSLLNERWSAICDARSYGEIEVPGGAKIRLYWDSIIAELIYKRQYEISEQLFTCRYLSAGDIYFDVGANIGLFTLIASKQVGPLGRVYAFEPANICINRLSENVSINGLNNVEIVIAAVSDHEGFANISIPTNGCDAWSTLGTPTWGEDIIKQVVKTTTLDKFQKYLGGALPKMIKIDVEGWENKALVGGENLLSSDHCPLLQVEFTDENAIAAGTSCRELYNKLRDFGFSVCHYDCERNLLVEESRRDAYPYVNLYTTKQLDLENQKLNEP